MVTCQKCKFFVESLAKDEKLGMCRSNPPQVVLGQDNQYHTSWPEVWPEDWCGRFEAKGYY